VSLNTLLAIVTILALIVAWNQLRLQRDMAGGKGIVINLPRSQVVDETAGIFRYHFDMMLRMVGPAVRHEVSVDLEADGRRFDANTQKPAIRESMGCEDDDIVWKFDLNEDDLEKVWLITSWVEARGNNLRTEAIAWRLSRQETYVWKWYPGFRLAQVIRGRVSQRGPVWFREWVGAPRATGWWHQERGAAPAGAFPGEGPLELRRPPSHRRLTTSDAIAIAAVVIATIVSALLIFHVTDLSEVGATIFAWLSTPF
jgi:hypothetical protein